MGCRKSGWTGIVVVGDERGGGTFGRAIYTRPLWTKKSKCRGNADVGQRNKRNDTA